MYASLESKFVLRLSFARDADTGLFVVLIPEPGRQSSPAGELACLDAPWQAVYRTTPHGEQIGFMDPETSASTPLASGLLRGHQTGPERAWHCDWYRCKSVR